MPRTETTHGYPILDRKPCPIPGSEFILAKLDHTYSPFVVWRMEADTGVCEGGTYCSTLERAVQALKER